MKKLKRKYNVYGACFEKQFEKYVECPNHKAFIKVPFEVCRYLSMFWQEPLANTPTPSVFAKKHCRNCTYWKRNAPEERCTPLFKKKRTVYLKPLPKLKRVLKATSINLEKSTSIRKGVVTVGKQLKPLRKLKRKIFFTCK